MASGVQNEIADVAGFTDTPEARAARRIAELYATDAQFAAAEPIPEVIDAARRPGLRLPEVIERLVAGYADRPALGQRARELITDPASGRTSARFLPRFDTITYRELWARVRALATAWRHDPHHRINAGDFVATVGFASPDYLTIDLVCAYLGLVSVPLQHSAPVSQLRPIIDEVEPRVLAISAAYLDVAVESVLNSASLRHVVVFDYQPEIDDQREKFEHAQERLHAAGMPVVVQTIDEIIERGSTLPPEPFSTPAVATSSWR